MASANEGLEWKFSQVFGDKSPIDEVTDVDIVSAIEFDHTGEFIAAGDRGGRVVVFEKAKQSKKNALPEYKFYCEFQSHEPEFDPLKSLEIEEKINKIKWSNQQSNSHLLLTTNDKTIKLWRVYEKKLKNLASATPARDEAPLVPANGQSLSSFLKFPVLSTRETIITAAPRRVFANAHAYHINSISLNSDGETYISSDDLRINLWNLNIVDMSFNIVDIKPANMEELTEVITSAEFHPTQCNIFMYSSSKGIIKLGDMRHSALCDTQAKVFEEEEDPANKSFFSEITSSISDIKFAHDGMHLIARDYLTLKVWDLRMERSPVSSIPIHDHLRSKLCDLYENDCIFDKFECTLSGDGRHYLTGSYHNVFMVLDAQDPSNSVSIEASKFSKSKQKVATMGPSQPNASKQPLTSRPKGIKAMNPETTDYTKKILHVAHHPRESTVAIAASNNLFIYHAQPPSMQ